MKITTLVENYSECELKPEWGLALFIEYQGKTFLLDTGCSKRFIENANFLNVDLTKVDYAVLSHAHFDHAYGMKYFFRMNSTTNFYLRSGSLENCYSQDGHFRKYIGIRKGTLRKYKNRIIMADNDYQVCPGVWLIPHKTPNLDELGKASHMTVKINGKHYPDSFSHEQSLVFETSNGLVIFNSCSHGGADNIINEVQMTFPDKEIYAYVGGFHTFRKSEEYILEFAARLDKTGIPVIYTGHCTGQKSYAILKSVLGNRIQKITTGTVFQLSD